MKENPFSSVSTALVLMVAAGLLGGSVMFEKGRMQEMGLLVVAAVMTACVALWLTKSFGFDQKDLGFVKSFLCLGSMFFMLDGEMRTTDFTAQMIAVGISVGIMGLGLICQWLVPDSRGTFSDVKAYSGLLALLGVTNLISPKDFATLALTLAGVVCMAAMSIAAVLIARGQQQETGGEASA